MRLILAVIVLISWIGTPGCIAPRQDPLAPVAAAQANASLEPLKQAAEAGNPQAQMELGRRYRDARGLPRDNINAYVWFRMAAVHDVPGASEARDQVAAIMLEDEIEEAEVLVRQWARFQFQDAVRGQSATDRFGPTRKHDSPQEPRPAGDADGPATRKALEQGGKRKDD